MSSFVFVFSANFTLFHVDGLFLETVGEKIETMNDNREKKKLLFFSPFALSLSRENDDWARWAIIS